MYPAQISAEDTKRVHSPRNEKYLSTVLWTNFQDILLTEKNMVEQSVDSMLLFKNGERVQRYIHICFYFFFNVRANHQFRLNPYGEGRNRVKNG